MSRQGRQAVRRHLFAQDPHCHWCGCEVVLFEGKPGWLPENAATIDHLVTRLDANGSRTPEQGRQRVLACLKCNRDRGIENQRRHQRERGSIDGYALS